MKHHPRLFSRLHADLVSLYRRRWQWWPPNETTDWWIPRIFRGSDEHCNPSLGFVIPPLGTLVVFWKPGPLRTQACPEHFFEEDEPIEDLLAAWDRGETFLTAPPDRET